MSLTGIHDRFVLVRAPAKLNLFLEVRSKRPDGYHEIETVMAAVSLFDSLRFQTAEDDRLIVRCIPSQDLRIAGHAVPEGPANIAWKALDGFRQSFHSHPRTQGGSLDIFKRIPDQAGMGGGSSDAAAALRAARIRWMAPIDESGLMRIASQVGSDVPFFIEPGMSRCRGRGESIEVLPHPNSLWFVVVKPRVGLSTKMVYEHVSIPTTPRSGDAICSAIQAGTPGQIGRLMWNRLQSAAESLAPEIQRAAAEFDRLECCGHQLTGSGSAYFGLFANRVAAKRAEQILRSRLAGWFVRSCHSNVRENSSTGRPSSNRETVRDHH